MLGLKLQPGEQFIIRTKCRLSRPKIGKCQVGITSRRILFYKKSICSSKKTDFSRLSPSLQTNVSQMNKFFFSKPQYMFKIVLRKDTSQSMPHTQLIFKLSGDVDVKEQQFDELKKLFADLLDCSKSASHKNSNSADEFVVNSARERAAKKVLSRIEDVGGNVGHQLSQGGKSLCQIAATKQLTFAQKRAALQSDVNLKRSYNEVVRSGVVTDSEFWENFQSKQRLEKLDTTSLVFGRSSAQATTERHVTTDPHDIAFTDDAIKTHVRLDAVMIRSIFIKHPHVFERYKKKVPIHMTESQFWTEYFNAVKFQNAGISTKNAVQITSASVTQDEKALSQAELVDSKSNSKDPRFNLIETDSDNLFLRRDKLQLAESRSPTTRKNKSKRTRKRKSNTILESLNAISERSLVRETFPKDIAAKAVCNKFCSIC